MQFVSTRSPASPVSFREALLSGLAPDKGLYYPLDIPSLKPRMATFRDMDFIHIAEEMTAALLGDELPADLPRHAFPFSPRLVPLNAQISLLELFHGPTAAFKDFGASFLAQAFASFLNEPVIILTATSGDTGSAVASAFYGKENVQVVILYPSGGISRLQEQQIATYDDNITTLEIQGSFDDCQALVKQCFIDPALQQSLRLSSANSINIGRLLPQSFYYIFAASKMEEEFSFCVPSGNFGNLTAGILAWQWGMQAGKFLAATNANDVVPLFLEGKGFHPRSSIQTYANAMDVGNPSNFERLEAIAKGMRRPLAHFLHAMAISDKEILETIHRYHQERGVLLCPHTATGVLAAERYIARKDATHIVCLATADPGKFPETIQKATGATPALPSSMQHIMEKEKHSILMSADLSSLRQFLLQRYT